MDIRKVLIALGLLILLAGLAWPYLTKLLFGRLPGDIAITRENFRFYFPIVTSLLLSLLLTLVLWLLRRF